MSKFTDAFRGLWDSLVRTYVPWVVGAIVGLLTASGIPLDPEVESQVTLTLTLVAGAIYYALARVVERVWPHLFGWVLGSPKQPTYSKPE